MKNHLASHINGARRKGVTQGIEFMAGLILLALNNIADEYIEEEKIGQVQQPNQTDSSASFSLKSSYVDVYL